MTTHKAAEPVFELDKNVRKALLPYRETRLVSAVSWLSQAGDQEQLRLLIRRSPRLFGKQTSVWSLQHLADVCFAEGITTRHVSGETVRATLERMGIAWKRAKEWIHSPDPGYTPKKSDVTG